jgi:hypothetical protein
MQLKTCAKDVKFNLLKPGCYRMHRQVVPSLFDEIPSSIRERMETIKKTPQIAVAELASFIVVRPLNTVQNTHL